MTNKFYHIDEYNTFFITSHIMLGGWISVTLLFLMLALNTKLKMHYHIITPICITLTITTVIMSYNIYNILKRREKQIEKQKMNYWIIPSQISLLLFIVTIIVSMGLINRLVLRTYFKLDPLGQLKNYFKKFAL